MTPHGLFLASDSFTLDIECVRHVPIGVHAWLEPGCRCRCSRPGDPAVRRPALTVERAADVLWTYSFPELYDLLVVRSGWDLDAYATLVVDGLLASLLDPARAAERDNR